MNVEVADHGAWKLITLEGELDLATAPDLEEALPEDGDVLVDLSKLRFMDSSGLRMLIAGDQALRAAGGGLSLVAPTGHVLRVLEITGMAAAFKVLDELPAVE